jgi:glutamate carboxypeptidase
MKTEARIADAIRHYEKEMFQLLREAVMVSSGTYHKAGVDTFAQLVRSFIVSMPWAVDVVNQTDFGDLLVIRTKRDCSGKGILIVGHMDTVFPPDHPFKGFREDKDCIYGPGVLDMKGGIVVGLRKKENWKIFPSPLS